MSGDRDDLADLAREVLRRREAATKGPWTAHLGEYGDKVCHGITAPDGTDIVEIDYSGCYYAGDTPELAVTAADAAYIEAACNGADRLARAVLDGAVAMVEYRPGLPSVEDVRAHEERHGGCWLFRLVGSPQALLVRGVRIAQCPGPTAFYRAGPSIGNSYGSREEEVIASAPVLPDGTPAAWPGEPAPAAGEGLPVEQREGEGRNGR